jgi:vomeronasal 2 receptor
MAPKNTSLAHAMFSLMLHFSWTWVAMLNSEDKNSLRILSELREVMDKKKV